MQMKLTVPWILVLLLASMAASASGESITHDNPALRALTEVTFELDTSSLIGHGAAPFFINFQLTDGSGTNDGNNKVVISNFDFGGGGVAGTPVFSGGVLGDLRSAVILTDTHFLNSFTQFVMPGRTLRFTMVMDPMSDPDQQNDEVSFAILGGPLRFEIPTFGPADALIVVDLASPSPAISTYGTRNVPIDGAAPIDIGAPRIVPEAATNALVGISLIFLSLVKRRRIQA